MQIRSIGIIGAGTMGNGIAQVAAGAGFEVTLLDINDAALEKGLAALNNSLDRLIKKESITAEQKAQTLARIKTTTHYADLASGAAIVLFETALFLVVLLVTSLRGRRTA